MTRFDQPLFALDIGTRSVVGMIIQEEENAYRILDYGRAEHQERSMVDGQIHDVIAVSNVIRTVKETLETKHGQLKQVAVAAAGRSLQTKRSTITRDINAQPLLQVRDIQALELEAVQEAQSTIAQELQASKQTDLYCVGYSVLHYRLDDQEIGSLIDQRGNEAEVEVIATFLPRVVVDSLIAALGRAGLEMAALTLEPIAAINLLIPPTMRRLNIALIDIGAGTSDIAITAEGTITAYGMVPSAGDEITEAISQEFLLDFTVAEQVKRQLREQKTVRWQDILGFENEHSAHDVVKRIQPAIAALAKEISAEIIRLNKQIPQAVLMIGGGALTPTLDSFIAEVLGLPSNRVGIRELSEQQTITYPESFNIRGPELVTPIGIALASKQNPVRYVAVTVNAQPVRLFDLMRLTVGDAILAAGIQIRRLHGKPGLGISVEVNGIRKYIPGEYGHPPVVECNDRAAELSQRIQNQDRITVRAGKNGADAKPTINDVLDKHPPMQLTMNDQTFHLEPEVLKNGQKATVDDAIQDRDTIETTYPTTIADVLEQTGWDIATLDTQTGIIVYFNDQRVEMKSGEMRITVNDQPASLTDTYEAGAHIRIQATESGTNYLFQDVFRYIEIDPKRMETSGKMVLRINGEPAGFHSPIRHGDRLELKWE